MTYNYNFRHRDEVLLLIYATDPRLGSNQQVLKLVEVVEI